MKLVIGNLEFGFPLFHLFRYQAYLRAEGVFSITDLKCGKVKALSLPCVRISF
jgi:hypothetical protein